MNKIVKLLVVVFFVLIILALAYVFTRPAGDAPQTFAPTPTHTVAAVAQPVSAASATSTTTATPIPQPAEPSATPTPTPTSTATSTQPVVLKHIVIPAQQDTYVNQFSPDENFSQQSSFWLYQNSDTTTVYLRFPLAEIQGKTIQSATLNLPIHPNSTAAGQDVLVQVVDPKASWQPETVTYNSQPPIDPNAPTTTFKAGAVNSDKVWEEILAYSALYYILTGDHFYLDFALSAIGQWGEKSQEWYSLESGNPPTLDVYYWDQ